MGGERVVEFVQKQEQSSRQISRAVIFYFPFTLLSSLFASRDTMTMNRYRQKV